MIRRRALLGALLLALAPGAGALAQANSNANNYGNGAQLSVSDRTGDITFSTTLFEIPGIVSELNAMLKLSYRSDDARSSIQSNTRHFGLPFGWSLGIPFLYTETGVVKLNVDGTQVYQLDDGWRTSFTPTGTDAPLNAKTGLRQYNRADARLKQDQGSVTVNGVTSAFAFATLEGQVKYFSPGGLLLRDVDRFGNHLDYQYVNSANGGNVDNSTTTANAELAAIVDTWGHTITIAECLDPSSCVANETRITLPDGRTLGWVAPDEYTITDIIDTLGTVTHLQWGNSTCGDQSYGNRQLEAMALPTGGMTTMRYTCLEVCKAPSPTSCPSPTSWTVVAEMIQCPNNAGGEACPQGSPGADFQTTRYQYGTSADHRNYTGYPRYSPAQPSVAGADALMSAPDAGSFTYTTVITQHRANGDVLHQVESDYNFLHLQQEQRVYVTDGSSPNLLLSKVKSNCYPISDDANPADGCPLTTANYQNLPSNYQSPIVTGSCQFNLDGSASGRVSVMTMAYDGFGNVVNKRIYHGTAATGIMDCSSRPARLDPSPLKLLRDEYTAYDTPAALDGDGYVDVGPGTGHFGLPLGELSFIYLDDDESGVGAHGALGDSDDPVLVKLMCNRLTTGEQGAVEEVGSNVKSTVHGLAANSAAKPQKLGIVDACASEDAFDESVAPPKKTTYSYDGNGRGVGAVTEWAGTDQPEGIAAVSTTTAYALGDAASAEESCGGGQVLQVTSTDSEGNATYNRVCTENGFHLSAIDANGNTTLMEHASNGVTTKVTLANGSAVSTDYYYACPVAQDGSTQTCPATSTAPQQCPADFDDLGRNCTVQTVSAGGGRDSYADGVVNVTVRDGLGRIVARLDNTGGGDPGAGFSEIQVRSRRVYDDRGMLVSESELVGASDADPLVYETSTTYGAKLRPKMVCGPRGEAQEFVHDDVGQTVKSMVNGSDREAYAVNDSQKLSKIASCAVVDGSTKANSVGSCPTVAADTSSTECGGDAYMTYTLYDGSGVPHSITASAGEALAEGASVTSVNGQTTFSADMLKYAYSYTSNATGSGAVTAHSSFVRDLQGQKLEHTLSITTDEERSFTSDHSTYNAINELVSERNKLSTSDVVLDETFAYTPTKRVATTTSYEGVQFHNYYDEMNRLVRHCFKPPNDVAQGERLTLDPITGATLRIAKYTNPGDCSADDGGDVETGVFEEYAYSRIGKLERLSYSDGTALEWAFDRYQRPTCFADAMATANGNDCPDSPTEVDFAPDPAQLLVSYSYYPDDDPYRRGMLYRTCRGVPDGAGGATLKCVETDYYTPVSEGGFCPDSGLGDVTGAFSGMVMTETLCTGSPCDGSNTVYTPTHLYDEHRRPCVAESVDAAGAVILSSSYRYDQYNNVVHEESRSDLAAGDAYTDSNYQIDYTYDGMLRLIGEDRRDLDGNAIKNTTYAYDAASNLIEKVETLPDEVVMPPTPPASTPTSAASTRTAGAATATPAAATPTRAGGPDDDGCTVDPGRPSAFFLVLPILAVLVTRHATRRRGGAARSSPAGRGEVRG